jgi:hypothetical protein
MQIPFIGDIEDDSITNQEKIPAGHAATRFQRGYHFLLLNPILSVPGRIVTFSTKIGILGPWKRDLAI